jgi:hypothetical protein
MQNEAFDKPKTIESVELSAISWFLAIQENIEKSMPTWLPKSIKIDCSRRASPPHPKTLAISVKTFFFEDLGFCVWPIQCATLASPWRSFR